MRIFPLACQKSGISFMTLNATWLPLDVPENSFLSSSSFSLVILQLYLSTQAMLDAWVIKDYLLIVRAFI